MFSEEGTSYKPDPHYIFVKGRFKSNSSSLYGIFFIMLNPEGNFEQHNVVVSTFSDVYDLPSNEDWTRFEEAIINYRWKGNYNNSLTASLLTQLENINKDGNLRKQFFDSVNDYDYKSTETMLFDAIKRILQDRSVSLDISIQECTQEDLQAAKERRKKSQEDKFTIQQSSGFSVEEGATILSAGLILAPVKGKPLFELKIGDKIMIRLDGSNPQARRYIELYKLNVDSSVKPMPGEVVDIKADSKTSPIEILLKIDEHLYAKCSEEERQVKLRLYDQRLDGTYKKASTGDVRVQQDKAPEQKSSTTMLMLGLVAGIAILLMLALYLLL